MVQGCVEGDFDIKGCGARWYGGVAQLTVTPREGNLNYFAFFYTYSVFLHLLHVSTNLQKIKKILKNCRQQ